MLINKWKKSSCYPDDFTIPADHRVKIKESEKLNKYLDRARELKKKKLWNMKVMVIPIIVGTLGTVLDGLEKYRRNWKPKKESRPYRLQHYQDRLEYWEESWRPEETFCRSDSSERPLADTGGKDSHRVK